jgi:hypothetical protein
MANNENAFQIALKDQAIKEGANAMRIRHFSLVGVPDLYIKMLGEPSAWIECKFKRKCPKEGTQQPTPAQLAWIRKEQKAGGIAGWALCVKLSIIEWAIYVGVDETFHPIHNFLCVRGRGKIWDVSRIVTRIQHMMEEQKL